jgi:hypothetical protein
MDIIPTPLGPDDRLHAYWWELSMRQIETSRTLVRRWLGITAVQR